MKTFLKAADVMEATGLGLTALYASIRAGTFPKPIKIGLARKLSRWDSEEVEAWQKVQIAKRDEPAPTHFKRRGRPKKSATTGTTAPAAS